VLRGSRRGPRARPWARRKGRAQPAAMPDDHTPGPWSAHSGGGRSPAAAAVEPGHATPAATVLRLFEPARGCWSGGRGQQSARCDALLSCGRVPARARAHRIPCVPGLGVIARTEGAAAEDCPPVGQDETHDGYLFLGAGQALGYAQTWALRATDGGCCTYTACVSSTWCGIHPCFSASR